MKGALHNHAGFHAHQRQRTGAVTPVVRGFKIDGDEGGRVQMVYYYTDTRTRGFRPKASVSAVPIACARRGGTALPI